MVSEICFQPFWALVPEWLSDGLWRQIFNDFGIIFDQDPPKLRPLIQPARKIVFSRKPKMKSDKKSNAYGKIIKKTNNISKINQNSEKKITKKQLQCGGGGKVFE